MQNPYLCSIFYNEMTNFKMLAKTFFGMEDILANELIKLGAQNVKTGTRSVEFYGDKGFMYKANLALRTAVRILKPIHAFKITNEHDLYQAVKAFDWSTYLNINQSFVIDSTMYSEVFNDSQFLSLKVKDAIVDQFRERTGERPSIDKVKPNLYVHVHLDRDNCTISLDSSGESLHQRGYRTATNVAPLNEVLAAGLLLLAGWDGSKPFLDPMCGSGTLLIEAAMIACNIPANINRKEFAFEKWNDWEPELFDTIVDALLSKTKDYSFKLHGFDISKSTLSKTQENIENANLTEYITIEHQDFFESRKETEQGLFMMFNPPYGERMPIEMDEFYKKIGDTLKQNYPHTEAWFITSNIEAIKQIGLRPSRKIKVFNGNLESRLLRYDMYAGSKRAKFNSFSD